MHACLFLISLPNCPLPQGFTTDRCIPLTWAWVWTPLLDRLEEGEGRMGSASLSIPSSTLSWTPVGLCFPAGTGNPPQPWQIWTSIVTNRHEGRLEVRSQSLTGCVYRDTRPGASEPLLVCSGLGRLLLRLHSDAGSCGKVPTLEPFSDRP